MSADLAVHEAVRQRLTGNSAVTALIPAGSILDINQRPAPTPSIIIGEGMVTEGDRIDRRDLRVILDLHLWKKEQGLTGVKAVAGAIRAAINSARLVPVDGFQFGDCRVTNARFLRDPDGETAHGIVTIETLVVEAA